MLLNELQHQLEPGQLCRCDSPASLTTIPYPGTQTLTIFYSPRISHGDTLSPAKNMCALTIP